MTSGYEYLKDTPCAGCVHMSWDLFYDEPACICTMKLRNRYGAWKPAQRKCAKLGFEFFEREEWKAEKAEAWAKENSVLSPENAVPAL